MSISILNDMMMVMAYVLMLIFLCSLTAVPVYFSRSRFSETIPLSFLFAAMALYGFGFLKKMSLGYFLCWGIIIAFWIYFAVKGKDRKAFFERFFDKGFFIFLIVGCFLFFLQERRHFLFWDEFGHWGMMVKETLRLDRFYSAGASLLRRHKDYPPLFTLIEVLGCYFHHFKYSEGACYSALTLFSFSLFFPALGRKKNGWISVLTGTVCALLFFLQVNATPTASDGAHLLNSIYVDWPLSLLTACIFYVICVYDHHSLFDLLRLSLLLISLLLTKQMGTAFYLLTIVFFFFKKVFLDKEKKDWLRVLFFLVVLPVGFLALWKIYISLLGVAADSQFRVADIGIAELLKIIRMKDGSLWQYQSYVNYLTALFHRPLYIHPLSITYFPFAAGTAFLVFLFSKDRKKALWTGIFYLLGSIAYAFAMGLLYMSSFGPWEGPMLASFDRYMISYLLIGSSLLVMLMLEEAEERKVYLPVLVSLLLLTGEKADVQDLLPWKEPGRLLQEELPVNDILHTDIKEGEKILIIREFPDNIYIDCLLEYAQDDTFTIKAVQAEETALQDYLEMLKDHDYIYLLSFNNEFLENYWHPITDSEIYQYGLYRIEWNGDEVTFTLLQVEYL